MMSDEKPLRKIKDAINEGLAELGQQNHRVANKVVDDIVVGAGGLFATLRDIPATIAGVWEDVNKTMDILDLIDEFQKERDG